MRFGDMVTYKCKPGYSFGGMAWSANQFRIRCKDDGTYTEVTKTCLEPKMQVSGEVTDAQSAQVKVAGATITFAKAGATVLTLTADASGRFTGALPKGELKLSASKDGYIAMTKDLSVTGNIQRGQGADMALSKVLPPGGWRTTVSWQKDPGDVDSHAYFGKNFNTHVYWPSRARTATASGTGGIKVVLDRDDVNGFGPETTTFLNLGNCYGANNCLIKFQIKRYSGRGILGQGKPIVRVFRGDSMEAEYHVESEIPTNIGRNLWTAFTLYAGPEQKLYKGEVKERPYLSDRQEVANWWGSLDNQMWSRLPGNALLTGMYRHPNGRDRVFAIEEGRYRRVKNTRGETCYNANWWGSFDRKGWSNCKTGYFMAGIYRTGHMWDRTSGIHQLEMARCCKPKGGNNVYGTCTKDNLFNRNGVSQCGAGKAITGLYRSNDNSINGMDKMKCCELEGGFDQVR